MWIIGSFIANRAYIAKNLCINKNIENSTCKGSCQLNIKLQQDKDNHEKSGIDSKTNIFSFFTVQENFSITYNIFVTKDTLSVHSRYKDFIPQQFVAAIFHPPTYLLS